MTRRGRGKIIFIASMLTFQGGLNAVSYAAAKFAIAGLTRALPSEWAPHGVNVNAIAPGYIATDITRPLQDDPERSAAIVGRIPAGRWGAPEDLAGAKVSSPLRPRTTCTERCSPWTGGWPGRYQRHLMTCSRRSSATGYPDEHR